MSCFIEPFETTAPAWMAVEAVTPEQTKVSWSFSRHLNYPMNLKLALVDMEEMIGNDLLNLKQELER